MLYVLLILFGFIILYCIYKISVLSYRIKILYISLIAFTYGIQKGEPEKGLGMVPSLLKFHGITTNPNNLQSVYVTLNNAQKFIQYHQELFQESEVFTKLEKEIFK